MTIKRNHLISSIILIAALLLTACSGGGSGTTYYNVNFNSEGQGEITPDSGEYKENEKLELKAEPDLGWGFQEWQGGLESTENPYSDFTVDGDYNITAVFEVTHPLVGEVEVSNKTITAGSDPSSVNNSQIKTQNINNNKLGIKASSFSKSDHPKYKEQEIIIKYKNNTELKDIKKLEEKNKLEQLSKLSDNKLFTYQLPSDQKVKEAVESYQQLSQVEYAQPNYTYQLAAVPNDTYYSYQWGPVNLNLEAAWDVETGTGVNSEEVNVAVIDTGIIPNHPDLEGRISSAGYDFVENDAEPYDINKSTDEEGNTSYKTNGHGTHVAGILGAVGDNDRGIAGTNWNVNIIPIRVLGADGTGDTTNFVKALKYAAGEEVEDADGNKAQISEKVDIINLSLGESSSEVNQAMEDAVSIVEQKGILTFAAAGNEGQSEVMIPARYEETIAVGAINENNERSYYSHYGPNLDLMAPGNSILSTYGEYDNDDNEFIYYPNQNWNGITKARLFGTSMATPYVSGVASLLLAQGVDASKVESRLKDTAVDLGPEGKDEEYGYGLVDAYGALEGKKLEPPRVFAATTDGDALAVESEMKKVENKENYKFSTVDREEVYIVGWRDVNGNGDIDQGDYYGEIGPFTFDDSQVQNNDLQLNYVGEEVPDVSLGTEILELPLKVPGIN